MNKLPIIATSILSVDEVSCRMKTETYVRGPFSSEIETLPVLLLGRQLSLSTYSWMDRPRHIFFAPAHFWPVIFPASAPKERRLRVCDVCARDEDTQRPSGLRRLRAQSAAPLRSWSQRQTVSRRCAGVHRSDLFARRYSVVHLEGGEIELWREMR